MSAQLTDPQAAAAFRALMACGAAADGHLQPPTMGQTEDGEVYMLWATRDESGKETSRFEVGVLADGSVDWFFSREDGEPEASEGNISALPPEALAIVKSFAKEPRG